MLLPLCGCGAASADHFKMARAGRDRIHRRAQPRWVGFQMAAAIGSTGTAHPFHPRPHHCPGPGLITARVPASSLPGLGLHRCRGSGFIAAWARASSLPGHGSHHCRGSGLIVAGAGGVPLSLPLPAPMTARLPDLPGYLHLVADGQRHLWDGLELRMGSGSGGGANEHRY